MQRDAGRRVSGLLLGARRRPVCVRARCRAGAAALLARERQHARRLAPPLVNIAHQLRLSLLDPCQTPGPIRGRCAVRRPPRLHPRTAVRGWSRRCADVGAGPVPAAAGCGASPAANPNGKLFFCHRDILPPPTRTKLIIVAVPCVFTTGVLHGLSSSPAVTRG